MPPSSMVPARALRAGLVARFARSEVRREQLLVAGAGWADEELERHPVGGLRVEEPELMRTGAQRDASQAALRFVLAVVLDHHRAVDEQVGSRRRVAPEDVGSVHLTVKVPWYSIKNHVDRSLMPGVLRLLLLLRTLKGLAGRTRHRRAAVDVGDPQDTAEDEAGDSLERTGRGAAEGEGVRDDRRLGAPRASAPTAGTAVQTWSRTGGPAARDSLDLIVARLVEMRRRRDRVHPRGRGGRGLGGKRGWVWRGPTGPALRAGCLVGQMV